MGVHETPGAFVSTMSTESPSCLGAEWSVRTDHSAPKHEGLSVLIVDTNAPGVSWTPIVVLDGHHTNATYFEDVRVPVSALVGQENDGWRLMTAQLNHERVALASAGKV